MNSNDIASALKQTKRQSRVLSILEFSWRIAFTLWRSRATCRTPKHFASKGF